MKAAQTLFISLPDFAKNRAFMRYESFLIVWRFLCKSSEKLNEKNQIEKLFQSSNGSSVSI